MEKPNKFTIRDNLFSIAFEHLERFKEAFNDGQTNRLESEIYFYHRDLMDIKEEALNILKEAELNDVLKMLREPFNMYMLDIFTN